MRSRWVMRPDGVGGWRLVPWAPPARPAAAADLPAPMVRGDLAPYRSMRTGETISGRAQHRAHLRQWGLEEVGNEWAAFAAPRPAPGPAAGAVAAEVKRQLARDPAERRAEAEGVLRAQGYDAPQITRIIGETTS